MIKKIEKDIKTILKDVGFDAFNNIEFSIPPKRDMGDCAFPCFEIAKNLKQNPAQVAQDIVEKIKKLKGHKFIDEVKAFGPYVNFFLNAQELAKIVLGENDDERGKDKLGKGMRVMVEFAHPNTHKAFHIGHLRNITTGESIVRILENAGYKVIRANYQGDVGMHIAKCLWGVLSKKYKVESIKDELKAIDDKVAFLGKAYAAGSKAFEESEEAKKEIVEINDKIYSKDKEIKEVYQETRGWSLEYFNKVYTRVGSHFDRLYFESETFRRGIEIVEKFLKKGIFKESEGAIIFEGSKHGLHDRVFINSKGFPTYEAKDLALAELQFKEYSPDAIYHVVAREQSEYFKVMFKALEYTLPKSIGKEKHLVYGWVSLKEGKMSSRTGNVVLGEWLLDEVKSRILEIMKNGEVKVTVGNREGIAERVALAAVKYAFLKTGISNDIQFDMKESISTSGDSGPYLLYIVARIKSILRKADVTERLRVTKYGDVLEPVEKKLLMQLARFGEATEKAALELDPSKIAQYLFTLAQDFNNFYHECPVLQAEDEAVKKFRFTLIQAVERVMTRGLYLLGVEVVEEM